MASQARSYTAATVDVDADGRGQLEATRELTNILLDPQGSTLQDILVNETAKLGDAAVRRALRAALIEGPTRFVLPGLGVKPAEALGLRPPAVLEALLSPSLEDERVLATAQELADLLGPQVRQQIGQVVPGEAGSASPAALTETVRPLVEPLVTDQRARSDAARNLECAHATAGCRSRHGHPRPRGAP